MRGQFNKSVAKGRDSSALVIHHAHQDIQSESASGEEGNDYWDEHGEFCEEIIVPDDSPLATNQVNNWRTLFNADELNRAYQ